MRALSPPWSLLSSGPKGCGNVQPGTLFTDLSKHLVYSLSSLLFLCGRSPERARHRRNVNTASIPYVPPIKGDPVFPEERAIFLLKRYGPMVLLLIRNVLLGRGYPRTRRLKTPRSRSANSRGSGRTIAAWLFLPALSPRFRALETTKRSKTYTYWPKTQDRGRRRRQRLLGLTVGLLAAALRA
jgi:hypothetical protein